MDDVFDGLIEVSSSTSSDDEVERYIRNSQNRESIIPAEFSVDGLIAEREREKETGFHDVSPLEEPKIPAKNFEEDFPELDLKSAPLSLEIGPDDTIYKDYDTHFPLEVLQYLMTPPESIAIIPVAEDSWIHYVARHHPEKIELDEIVICSLINGLAETGNPIFGETLVHLMRYIQFPLHFPVLIDLFHKVLRRDEELIVYVLMFFHVGVIADVEYYLNDIFLIHFGSLMSSCVIKHRDFFRTNEARLESMKPNLAGMGGVEMANALAGILFRAPPACLAQVLSYLQIDHTNAEFLRVMYMQVMQLYGHIEDEVPMTKEEIFGRLFFVVDMMKELIDSNVSEGLLAASAILALTERVLVASTFLNQVSEQDIEILMPKLQLTLKQTDTLHFTSIKEQIHLTRTQIETVAQELPDVCRERGQCCVA